jgi:hypothetical protein
MWGEKNGKNNMTGYGIGSIVYRRTAIGVETRTVGALRGEIKSMTFDELGDIYFKIVYENGLEETVGYIDDDDFCTFDEAISNERECHKKTDQHEKKPLYIPLDFVDGRYIAYFINKDRIDTETVDSVDLSVMLYGNYRSEISYMWIDGFQEDVGKKYFASRELAENELERIKDENTKYLCTCKVCGNKFTAKKPDIKRNNEKHITLANCDSCHTLREVDISE